VIFSEEKIDIFHEKKLIFSGKISIFSGKKCQILLIFDQFFSKSSKIGQKLNIFAKNVVLAPKSTFWH
jgi:hypothetical protein